jgi:hypothetical protein
MSTPYEIVISETHVATVRYLVEANSPEEAEQKAISGDVLSQRREEGMNTLMERSAIETIAMPARGSAVRRVEIALRKPDAFTIHARLWGAQGLGDEAEYNVYAVTQKGRDTCIELGDFPDGQRRAVPVSEIFGLRIDSESDEVSYTVTNIRYDTDGETAIVDLPDELEIDLPRDTEEWRIEDLLSDAISERTGWCHNGFDYEVAK